MKVIILAAGAGTRLGDITKSKPKCLLETGNTTILSRTTTLLKEYGFNDITIVVGAKGDVWNKKTYTKIKERI